MELARPFITKKNEFPYPDPIPGDFVAGLENTRWPGRCQTVLDPNYPSTTWYLDGAHTEESLKCCIEWFVDPSIGISKQVSLVQSLVLNNDVIYRNRPAHRPLRILIFNCTNGRSGEIFLGTMFSQIETQLSAFQSPENASHFFDQVIFCSNVTYIDGHFKGGESPECALLRFFTCLA